MKYSLPLFALTVALALSGCGSKAASKNGTTTPAAQAPVVATSFSDLTPTVGQRESVYVQFFKGPHPLAGGRLSVKVTFGKRTIQLKGGATDTHGRASVRFTIPSQAQGKTLSAITTVVYKSRRYAGSNQVKVAK